MCIYLTRNTIKYTHSLSLFLYILSLFLTVILYRDSNACFKSSYNYIVKHRATVLNLKACGDRKGLNRESDAESGSLIRVPYYRYHALSYIGWDKV